MTTAEIKVYGKVQGVWFRDHVKKAADKLKLTGWVKNNPDGTVSSFAEGDRTAILELLRVIEVGSPMSNVENVEVQWSDGNNYYESFKIIR